MKLNLLPGVPRAGSGESRFLVRTFFSAPEVKEPSPKEICRFALSVRRRFQRMLAKTALGLHTGELERAIHATDDQSDSLAVTG